MEEIIEPQPIIKDSPEDRFHKVLIELTEQIGRDKVRSLVIDALGYGW